MIAVHENDTRRPPNDGATASLPPCKHCGEEFDDHMQDGEPLYMCPPECQMNCGYGYFHGGDPRNFHPDYESCSPEEIANHKAACEYADKFESETNLRCPSGWERLPDGTVCHVLRAPFGIGTYTYPPTCYEPEAH